MVYCSPPISQPFLRSTLSTATKTALQWKMAIFGSSVFAAALDPEVEQYRVGMRFTPSIHPTTKIYPWGVEKLSPCEDFSYSTSTVVMDAPSPCGRPSHRTKRLPRPKKTACAYPTKQQ